MKIGFIGSGKMAEAIISGVLNSGIIDSENILCSDINKERINYIDNKYKTSTFGNNSTIIDKCDLIFLCVKPQDIKKLKNDLYDNLRENQSLLSILAGIKISTLSNVSNHKSIVRIMPNTPAQIKKGVSVWTHTNETSKKHVEYIEIILNSIGTQYKVENEETIEMATALSASGPAYLFYFIESLIESGENIGLPKNLSEKLTLGMLKGSLDLFQASNETAEKLRENVTSPGGTTEAAINILQNNNFKNSIIEAINAAHKRGLNLGE